MLPKIVFRVRVNAYEKALVFRHGKLIDVLDQGLHWVNPFAKVLRYDVTELFYHDIDIDLLLHCQALSDRLYLVEVSDQEIAIEYKGGNFHRVLTPGRYAYWHSGLDLKHDLVDLNKVDVDESISRKVLRRLELAKYLTAQSIEGYERGVLYIDGEVVRELDPGVYYFWDGSQNAVVSKVDLRSQLVEISGQELLTKDKASVRMSLFAHFKVTDVLHALVENKDYYRQLYVILQLGLREYVGQYSLDELLQNKASVGSFILEYAQSRADSLGLKLLDCGLRDIILPGDIKDIMNQVLLAEKTAQANAIMRREETASTRSLLNTAKLMSENEMLFKLKEMEYMERFADKVGQITVNGGGRMVDQLRDLVGNKQ